MPSVNSKIQVNWQELHEDALPPLNAYGSDAGWDLHVLEETFIAVGKGVDVRTGLAVAIPDGYFGRIVGRSSALRRRSLLVVEGIIDPGFRGELFSYVFNVGMEPMQEKSARNGWGVTLLPGDAVAQLIVQPVIDVHWVKSRELSSSTRGTAGFGSSGRIGR